MTQTKMKAAFYILLVSCWTISQATAAAISNNYQPQIGKKLKTVKADGALPILHIVFDVASGGANVQTLGGATRRLLNVLLPQNVIDNFESETMMSISTFTGSDSGDGRYLKVVSPPVNVIQNSAALRDIIQFNVSVDSVTNDANRDPGAAIRDALIKFSSQLNPDAADILYLISRRYVDGGPTVKELDVIDNILKGSMTLIFVEGANIDDRNRLLNLKRVAELTEGYYYTNTDTQTNSWANKNDAAINLMLSIAKSPINFVRRKVERKGFFKVSDVSQTGSFVVTPDLGNNSVIIIQSSHKGIVALALTNIQTGAITTLKTKVVANWNMINAKLYVDDVALSSTDGETRGRWTYSLTFEPNIDALDTESDVVILGLSSRNNKPLANLPGVSAVDCNLDFPDQNSTIIYAEVIGSDGVLTGLSITVTFNNVEDTSSHDVPLVLTEEVQGMGFYSGIFIPPSNGLYNFSAEFKADIDSVCIGDRCAPSNFSASAQGRCQIQVQGIVIEVTTMEPATSNHSTSTFDTNTTEESTSTSDTTTDDPTSISDTTIEDSTSTSDTTTEDPTSTSDTTADDSTTTSDNTTDDPTSTSDTITEDSTTTSDTTTGDSTSTSDTIAYDSTSTSDTTTDDSTSTSDTTTYYSTSTTDTITDDSTSTTDTSTNDSIITSDISTDDSTSTLDATSDDSTSTMDPDSNDTTSTIDTTTDDSTITSDSTTDELTNTTVSTTSSSSETSTTTLTSSETSTTMSTSNETLTTPSITTTMESSLTPTSSSSTSSSTSSSSRPLTIPPTNDSTVKQPPTAGFIIGLCLGIAFLIAFLLILLYCCCIAEKDKDEERESSVQEIPSTPSRRRFVQRWRLRWIPPAVLRRPPAITSSSLSTESMPYKTMDDDSTSTQPYRRINEKK